MDIDNTQGGAEPSLASDGSRPVAWVVMRLADEFVAIASIFEHSAKRFADSRGDGWASVPLYRSPSLTDEEREAIELARSLFDDYKMSRLHNAADEVLERLLERLT